MLVEIYSKEIRETRKSEKLLSQLRMCNISERRFIATDFITATIHLCALYFLSNKFLLETI